MILYNGFGHGAYEPKSMLALMQSNLDWFDYYIWKQPIPKDSPLWGTSELETGSLCAQAHKTPTPCNCHARWSFRSRITGIFQHHSIDQGASAITSLGAPSRPEGRASRCSIP